MAIIKRDEDGEITEIIERTKSHQEQQKEAAQGKDIQSRLVAYYHEQGFTKDKKPNVDAIPFDVTATDRDHAWSTYILELQAAETGE